MVISFSSTYLAFFYDKMKKKNKRRKTTIALCTLIHTLTIKSIIHQYMKQIEDTDVTADRIVNYYMKEKTKYATMTNR